MAIAQCESGGFMAEAAFRFFPAPLRMASRALRSQGGLVHIVSAMAPRTILRRLLEESPDMAALAGCFDMAA